MNNVWKTYAIDIEDKHILFRRNGVSILLRPWSKYENVAYHDDDDAMMNCMMMMRWDIDACTSTHYVTYPMTISWWHVQTLMFDVLVDDDGAYLMYTPWWS